MSLHVGPRTIRGRAVASSGLVIALFGAGIGLGAYVFVTQVASSSASAVLQTQVHEIADQLTEQSADDPASVDLESLQGPTPTFVQIVDARGSILAMSPQLDLADRLCPSPAPSASTSDRTRLTLRGTQGTFLRTTEQITAPAGVLTICAATSDQPIQRAQEAVLLALVIALPLLVVGGCVVVWLAVGRALRAVQDMAAQAEAMQSTSDGALTVPVTGDEIEHLARTLNALLNRLHQQTEATRQFIADAGHELRNPLSTLRVTLEFAESADPSDLRAGVQHAIRDLTRMEVLVEDLLALARVDSLEPPDFRSVDLAALIRACIADGQRRHPGRRVSVDAQPCTIMGNERALRSSISNLVDNAMRHARTTVDVQLQTKGGMARILVDDDGQGIRPADCNRVFERFVRLDEARDRDEGGSGLGLAIVRAVAQLHDGRAWADPGPGGHFSVELPIR